MSESVRYAILDTDFVSKREKVPIENILTDIYAGKYAARKDGDLQLKTE